MSLTVAIDRDIAIVGTGACLPENVVTNRDLEGIFDTTEDWIVEHLGIRERRWSRRLDSDEVADDQCNSYLAARAGEAAIEDAGLKPTDIDLVIQNTGTPDYATLPPTVALVQERIGIEDCAVIELRSACSGFAHGLTTAAQYLNGDVCRNVLVIGSDVISAHLNLADPCRDRLNASILADGAGAVVVRHAEDGECESGRILACTIGSAGVGREPGVIMPAGGSRRPATLETVRRGEHHFRQNAHDVLEFGTSLYVRGAMEVLNASGVGLPDIDHIVPHQANMQVATLCSEMFDVPAEKIFMNVARLGNTGSASVFVALDELKASGRLRRGDLVLLVGAEGGKWMYGAVLLRW